MYPASLQRLIAAFRQLPGVGEKTAERYALSIATQQEQPAIQLAQAVLDVKKNLRQCRTCGNFSEEDECLICQDKTRNHRQVFVVQSPKDVLAMENSQAYHGVYHVLNGLISPAKGILPDDLNIASLIRRVQDAEEVILATDATMDGETTALYLNKVLQKRYPHVLITRIAHGIPAGGMLDYADEITLHHAFVDRKKLETE